MDIVHGRDGPVGLGNDDIAWPRRLGDGQYSVVSGQPVAIHVSRMQGISSRFAARATILLWEKCLVAWECFITGKGHGYLAMSKVWRY
jgi:hypothetical protein